MLYALLGWFDAPCVRKTLPMMRIHSRAAAGPMGWWYVFGSASLTLLLLQIVTGIGLALTYVPSADQAYRSLDYLNYEQFLGWLLRSMHYWSGSAMTVMVAIHMTQVFLHGSYKYPRELTWIVGVFLLLMTLGMMFTGQILRWDTDANPANGYQEKQWPAVCRAAGDGWEGRSRRHAEPILRPACLRDPGPLASPPGNSSLVGAQVRHQRSACRRATCGPEDLPGAI
jgi:hypothetical protein